MCTTQDLLLLHLLMHTSYVVVTLWYYPIWPPLKPAPTPPWEGWWYGGSCRGGSNRRRRIETGVRKFSEEIPNFPNVSNYFYGPTSVKCGIREDRIHWITYIHCLPNRLPLPCLAQSSRYEIRAWEEGDYIIIIAWLHGSTKRKKKRREPPFDLGISCWVLQHLLATKRITALFFALKWRRF